MMSAKPARKNFHALPRLCLTLLKWLALQVLAFALLCLLLVIVFRFIPPPHGLYMKSQSHQLGAIKRDWQPLDSFARHVPLSVIAAEDADFCSHYGFDIDSIKTAWDGGKHRGASTLSQQVAKNVFLWHGRTWLRKGLEAGFTALIETFWGKRRILEVYLNVAELDAGVFGWSAGAQHYFGVAPDKITILQTARLAAILPNPKTRSASKPSRFVRAKTARILDGIATLEKEQRDTCF